MARIITYPTKAATLSAVSPVLYSAQNTEVNQIYQDLNDLDAGMALKGGESTQNFATNNLAISGTVTKSGQPLVEPGKLTASLEYVNATTLPKVKSGTIEFKGIPYFLSADYQLLSSGSALACNQSLDTYHWYNWVMDSTGALKWMPAFDITSPLVSGRSIGASGVVVSGTTFTINMASTAGMVAGNDIVLKDTDGGLFTCDGPFKIVSVSAGVSVTVQGRAVGNGTYNGGTCDSYYRINTLHGAIGGVTTDADIKKFTPSQQWCPSLQCYGLNRYGIPDSNPANVVYRVLGVGYNDNTTTSLLHVLSYKSGFDKNDNAIKMASGQSSVTAGASGVIVDITIPTAFSAIWGSDHTVTSGGTNKFRITANSSLKYNFSSNAVVVGNSGNQGNISLRKNGVNKKVKDINFTNVNPLILTDTLADNDSLVKNDYLDLYNVNPTYFASQLVSNMTVGMELL